MASSYRSIAHTIHRIYDPCPHPTGLVYTILARVPMVLTPTPSIVHIALACARMVLLVYTMYGAYDSSPLLNFLAVYTICRTHGPCDKVIPACTLSVLYTSCASRKQKGIHQSFISCLPSSNA